MAHSYVTQKSRGWGQNCVIAAIVLYENVICPLKYIIFNDGRYVTGQSKFSQTEYLSCEQKQREINRYQDGQTEKVTNCRQCCRKTHKQKTGFPWIKHGKMFRHPWADFRYCLFKSWSFWQKLGLININELWNIISKQIMMNRKFRANSSKMSCVEDKQKSTNSETLRNTIQKLKTRRLRTYSNIQKWYKI